MTYEVSLALEKLKEDETGWETILEDLYYDAYQIGYDLGWADADDNPM